VLAVAWHAVRVTEPLARSRGTVFLQVLVAALFLAVIGGSVGLAVGLRDRDHGNTGAEQTGGPTQGQQTQQEQIPQSQPETGSPSGDSSAGSCPERMGRDAGREDLTPVLYIETAQSEAWICQDGGGALYYQGHRFSDDGWQFLAEVRRDGVEYVATNYDTDPPTEYHVSRELLTIDTGDGTPEEQPAIGAGG
jgi:hypothetical protein